MGFIIVTSFQIYEYIYLESDTYKLLELELAGTPSVVIIQSLYLISL